MVSDPIALTDSDVARGVGLRCGATDVEVCSENGRVTVSGNVPHKRQKPDIGEIAWAIPSINDVQNNITIVARRRARAATPGREAEGGPVRKAGAMAIRTSESGTSYAASWEWCEERAM